MTMDKLALADRADAWMRTHPPDTGYTRRVFDLVCRQMVLPAGTNLLTLVVAQYTGIEEAVDILRWDAKERQLPYSQTHRFSPDRTMDCSSFWYVMMRIFFNKNIGTWTEAMLKALAMREVPWDERRIGDIPLYNFKAHLGRHVSHAAGMVVEPDAQGHGGMIGHTRSTSKPFQFQDDSYASANRVGCFRPLTNAQYHGLFVEGVVVDSTGPVDIRYGDTGSEVTEVQARLNAHLGTHLVEDGIFGPKTLAAVGYFLWLRGLPQDGQVSDRDLLALRATPEFPLLRQGSRGKNVRLMKVMMHRHGYGARLHEDNGNFGPLTDRQLTACQRNVGLKPDGICGDNTWGFLRTKAAIRRAA